MTHPVRLQLSRAKGFNLQAHSRAGNGLPAVSVARPGRWGNPWPIGSWSAEQVVAFFRSAATGAQPIELYRGLIPGNKGQRDYADDVITRIRTLQIRDLRGKNLACWCRADDPCHADVLLELANK